MISVKEVSDSFMFLAIKIYPYTDLDKLYINYLVVLKELELNPYYKEFENVYYPAKKARKESDTVKKMILGSLNINYDLINQCKEKWNGPAKK